MYGPMKCPEDQKKYWAQLNPPPSPPLRRLEILHKSDEDARKKNQFIPLTETNVDVA